LRCSAISGDAGQAGASFGDRNDLYGGIGANGSQGTNATELGLGATASDYAFAAGTVYNLNADHTISGHSDVTNPVYKNWDDKDLRKGLWYAWNIGLGATSILSKKVYRAISDFTNRIFLRRISVLRNW